MSENTRDALLIMGVGFIFIAYAVHDFVAGRMSVAISPRFGRRYAVEIDGEQQPVEFLIRVMLALVLGTALFSYGAYLLVG
jgi:hypothetical protein